MYQNDKPLMVVKNKFFDNSTLTQNTFSKEEVLKYLSFGKD